MLHAMSVTKNWELLHVLERTRQKKARVQHFGAMAVVLGFHSCQLQSWFKRLLTSPAFSCASGVRKKVQSAQNKC